MMILIPRSTLKLTSSLVCSDSKVLVHEPLYSRSEWSIICRSSRARWDYYGHLINRKCISPSVHYDIIIIIEKKTIPNAFHSFPGAARPAIPFLRLHPWASVALKYYFDIPLASIIMPARKQRKSVRLNLVAFRPDAATGLCPKYSRPFPRLHSQSIL